MSTLIEGFKREHSVIIDALKDARELGFLTKKGQSKLLSVKANLLEHIKEEDEKFYPVLWKEAERNKKLKEGLGVFAKDWGNVSSIAFGVLDRYEKGVLCERHLLDFATLYTVLHNRMKNEEDFLYGEYEKIDQ